MGTKLTFNGIEYEQEPIKLPDPDKIFRFSEDTESMSDHEYCNYVDRWFYETGCFVIGNGKIHSDMTDTSKEIPLILYAHPVRIKDDNDRDAVWINIWVWAMDAFHDEVMNMDISV